MIVVDAYASARVIPLLTNRVGAARRRLAWIDRFLCGQEDSIDFKKYANAYVADAEAQERVN